MMRKILRVSILNGGGIHFCETRWGTVQKNVKSQLKFVLNTPRAYFKRKLQMETVNLKRLVC
jgi:hypothetical protein